MASMIIDNTYKYDIIFGELIGELFDVKMKSIVDDKIIDIKEYLVN